ncbi:MAG: AAA family ATPase, partial [Planctomycetes bacterium]|nr:AAA family ATPase [Planctomycetota bacterium]
MLQELQINNFRCLREVNVPLRPLTVLVGPNDSGKTAALRALEYLVGVRNLEPFDRWRGDQHVEPSVTGRAPGFSIRRHSGRLAEISPHGSTLLQPTEFFQLPSDGVLMVSPGHPDEGEPPVIGPQGQNIPALLDHLLRRDRGRFDSFVETMRHLVAGLEKIEIATHDASTRRIDRSIEDGLRMPADRASVGVRLLLFFVAMAYHPKPPKLMLIEEPENSVHPKRLGDVVRLLREITQGKHGN